MNSLLSILITIGVWLFAGFQIWIYIGNLREDAKHKQIDEKLKKFYEIKVIPYPHGTVKYTMNLADEKDAILALMYVRGSKKLRDTINIINALEKPHKVEIVVTTTEK